MSKKFGKTRYVWSTQEVIGYLIRDSSEGVVLEKYYETKPGTHDLDYDVVGCLDGKTILYDFIEILEEFRKTVGKGPIIHVEINTTRYSGYHPAEEIKRVTAQLENGLIPYGEKYEKQLFQRKRQYLINKVRKASQKSTD